MPIKSFNSDFLKLFLHTNQGENEQTVFLEEFNINHLNSDDNQNSLFIDTLDSNLIALQVCPNLSIDTIISSVNIYYTLC